MLQTIAKGHRVSVITALADSKEATVAKGAIEEAVARCHIRPGIGVLCVRSQDKNFAHCFVLKRLEEITKTYVHQRLVVFGIAQVFDFTCCDFHLNIFVLGRCFNLIYGLRYLIDACRH